MKKSSKYILILFSVVLFMMMFIVTEPFFHLNRKLTTEQRIVQVPFTKKYYLTTKYGRPIVEGIKSWVITEEFIYGTANDNKWYWFIYDRVKSNISYFDSETDYRKVLESLKLPYDDLSNSESSVHIIYNYRLYPIK